MQKDPLKLVSTRIFTAQIKGAFPASLSVVPRQQEWGPATGSQ